MLSNMKLAKNFLLCAAIIIIQGFLSYAADTAHPHFTLVQLTDIHYTSNPPRQEPLPWEYHIRIMGYKFHRLNLADCERILQNTIDYINEKIKPDLVIITGDIANMGNDREALVKAKNVLDKLSCPYYPVIGDHDLNDGQDKKKNYKEVFGEINYSFDYRGWHFIMLGIYPDDSDLGWLKNDLDKNTDKPIILSMHRMLVASSLMKSLSRRYYCPELICPRADQIINILNNHGKVAAVLSGHSHTNYRIKKNKISYISTASLLEPPYEFRIIRLYKDRISAPNLLRTAHPLKK
jgi:predicted MPP superfamily phosphohydrolase